jgi:hypothetical protein
MNKLNRSFDIKLVFVTLLAGLMLTGSLTYSPPAAAGESGTCPGDTTLTANVVALDQAIMFNRLGAQNINWMVYALERDVVIQNQRVDEESDGNGGIISVPVPPTKPDGMGGDEIIPDGTVLSSVIASANVATLAGNVALRPDKRPRPMVLRVAAGDCLEVNLTNLLDPMPNPLVLPNPLIDNGCKSG